MTLSPFGQYTAAAAPTPDSLPDLALSLYHDLVEMIGTVVNFGLSGVKNDVERWLGWMLVGGPRPKPTVRTTHANGTNGYCITQDAVCAALQRLERAVNWNDPEHVKLIERATRPLPGSVPLGNPPQDS